MAQLTTWGNKYLVEPYSITSSYSSYDGAGTVTMEMPMHSIQQWGNGTLTTSGQIFTGQSYSVPPVKREETAVEWLKRQVNEVCDDAFREVRR